MSALPADPFENEQVAPRNVSDEDTLEWSLDSMEDEQENGKP